MFQRRQEICDRLLSRRDLTEADLDLFRQAVASGEASERERLVAEFCVRSGLRPEKIHALIDASGLPIDERIARVQRLAELGHEDRKSTRLNSSHVRISYAVFCFDKKRSPSRL